MSSNLSSNMSCGLKFDTSDTQWQRTLTKVLKKIRGVRYTINAEQGTALITGRVDPNKLLKKLSKGGKHAEICWVESGNSNSYLNNGYQYHPHGGEYHPPGPAYHPGYAMTSHYPQSQRPFPQYGYGYGYGYDPSYAYPTWA